MEDAHCPWFVNDRTINVLIDFADLNNDDSIGYLELSNVLLCDDIIAFAALVPNKKAGAQADKDNNMKIGQYGCTCGEVTSGIGVLLCSEVRTRPAVCALSARMATRPRAACSAPRAGRRAAVGLATGGRHELALDVVVGLPLRRELGELLHRRLGHLGRDELLEDDGEEAARGGDETQTSG